jgi:hypothetical protein
LPAYRDDADSKDEDDEDHLAKIIGKIRKD